jgi:uncharacterized membrane protein
LKKSRAEAFSDGVFAVAATLLVFNLADPSVKEGLGRALVELWPSYAAYAISFFTIVVIWVNHHAVLDSIERLDRRLLFINGLLLLTVAIIPFPTGVLAHYLQRGHDQTAAAVAYGLTMTTMSVAFSLFNLYARRFRARMVKLGLGRLLSRPGPVAAGDALGLAQRRSRAGALRLRRHLLRGASDHSRGSSPGRTLRRALAWPLA